MSMILIQTILAFIVLIGVLVFIHELGHFLAAKWCGIRADVFAVGMGPRLFGWNWKTGFTFGKLPKDANGEELDLEGRTDYRISAFPIGGYVKIAGMIDESMDAEFAARPPEPWEFRSKNTFQKAFVISAGVIMNFLLAVAVLATLNMAVGKRMYNTTTVGFLPETDPAYVAGLRENDRIKSVNGEPVEYFEQVWTEIYVESAGEDIKLDVDRNGQPMAVVIPRSSIPSDLEKQGQIIPYASGIHVALAEVAPGSPAEEADLKPGDKIISINGERVLTANEFVKYVGAHPTQKHVIEIERNGQRITREVTPGSNGKIGVGPNNSGPVINVSYGFGQAVKAGFNETIGMTGDIFNMIGGLFSGKAKFGESVAGPVMIAKAAQKSASEGFLSFLNLMALLSITLATMNILPIPALDGGHLLFILIEGVIRREVPLKFRMAVQQVGFVLLLALMVFVLYNDTTKLFGN
jgi:regulator of sigma E protease